MKSTAIFVGVNVAASIPLVFCQQAMAGGEAQLSGTADFLKSSLAEAPDAATAKAMLAGDPTFSSSPRQLKIKRDFTPTQVLSDPRAVAIRNTLAPIDGVKLRPFIPGRKLPSKADLESGLNAMAPQFDNGVDQSKLTAGISESACISHQDGPEGSTTAYGGYRPSLDAHSQNRSRLKAAARVASGYDRRLAPRSMPGQSPSTPGQVGFPCAKQAVANMQPVRGGVGGANEWDQLAVDLKAQGANPEMQSIAQQMATNNGGDLPEQPAATAGPAPFPLSLLPEASLKQFIGTTAAPGKRPQAGAPSYFGSWKQGQIITANQNLQPSGFHSYLGAAGRFGKSHMLTLSAFKAYVPMTMSSRRAAPNRPVESTERHISQTVRTPATIHVATYGPYVSHQTF